MPTDQNPASPGGGDDLSPAAERALTELVRRSVNDTDEVRTEVLALCGRLRAKGHACDALEVYTGLASLVAPGNAWFDAVLFATAYEVQRAAGMSHETVIADMRARFDAAYREQGEEPR